MNRRNINECPTCGAINCREHCDNCGICIDLKHDPYADKWRIYDSGTEIVHDYCMRNGTSDGKFHDRNNKQPPNEYILDEYRTIYRLGNTAQFKCTFCNRFDDLPRMLEHHKLEGFPCQVKLFTQLMNEKPVIIIDVKNHKLESWLG